MLVPILIEFKGQVSLLLQYDILEKLVTFMRKYNSEILSRSPHLYSSIQPYLSIKNLIPTFAILNKVKFNFSSLNFFISFQHPCVVYFDQHLGAVHSKYCKYYSQSVVGLKVSNCSIMAL